MDQPISDTTIRNCSPVAHVLSRQEMEFVRGYVQGLAPSRAAVQAGYQESMARTLLNKTQIVETIAILREQYAANLGATITRDTVTAMLLDAHKKASTAAEEIMAAKELGKLHGLYAPERHVSISANITRIDQLETMSDEQLAAIGRLSADSVRPLLPRAIEPPSTTPDPIPSTTATTTPTLEPTEVIPA